MKKSYLFLTALIPFFQGCKNDSKIDNVSVLRCGIGTDLITLDIGKCGDSASDTIVSQCFEGLTRFNEKRENVPHLAEKIDISKDGKTYTFYIKKGVKFHNGDELTAQDFKWTFERHLNKKFNSTTALSFLGDISGVKEYQDEKNSTINGIKVLNKYILQIKIDQPKEYFLSKLSSPVSSALNHRIAPKTEITQLKDFIGTGPFKLKERFTNNYTELVAHPHYHGQKIDIKSIKFFVIKDPSMMINKIKKEALDIAEIGTSQIKLLKGDEKLKKNILEISPSAAFYLEFNSRHSDLFRNPNLRLAIAHAIDQDEIVKEALDNNAVPAHYLIPPDTLGARSGKGTVPFDINRAKQILKDANIDLRKINIELTTPEKSSNNKIGQNIAVQLRKNLSLNIKVPSLSWGTYNAKLETQGLPFRLAGWILDYPDPSNILSLFDSKSKHNHCGFNNAEFDQFVRKANNIINSQERVTLYRKAEDLLLKEAYVIPLFVPKRYWWVNSRVKKLQYNAQGLLPYNTISLDL